MIERLHRVSNSPITLRDPSLSALTVYVFIISSLAEHSHVNIRYGIYVS